ncbi:hypothetical protein KQX54_005076 [Cotesia glomerata]|uniref:C2H2-type domain-containing protein n=1 Tax=Cotesia glomerata TaxID=32391 RepID=A0AAV7J2P0_COTGL|nr:hypothetical protein KQX54_005076 [Cotesia glomerata]
MSTLPTRDRVSDTCLSLNRDIVTPADREVTGEDGGWQSATATCESQGDDDDRDNNDDDDEMKPASRAPVSTYRGVQTATELPIIELLDDIDAQMAFKTESVSPKIRHETQTLVNSPSYLLDKIDNNLAHKDSSCSSPLSAVINPCHFHQDYAFNIDSIPCETLMEEGSVSSPKLKDFSAMMTGSRKSDNEMKISHRAGTSSGIAPSGSGSTSAGAYCTFCRKMFSRTWSLQRHLADTHFYVPQSLTCDQCGRNYKSRNSLISHKSQYHALTLCLVLPPGLLAGSSATDEFRCEPCNKNLTSLTRLKRHIQNVHTRPSKEPICNICKRVYSSLNSLRNHKSIYHRQHGKIEQQRKDEEHQHQQQQLQLQQQREREIQEKSYSHQQPQHQHSRMG